MMKGRPSNSKIKNGLINILFKKRLSYGYELFKLYEEFYGKTSLRNIYYNLKRGLKLGEIILVNVKRELGNYSWGDESERVYYALGPYAEVSDSNLKIKPSNFEPNLMIDLNKLINELRADLKKGFTNKSKLVNRCDKLISFIKKNLKNDELVNEVLRIKETLTP